MENDSSNDHTHISGGWNQGFIQENHGTVNQNFITQVSEAVHEQLSITSEQLSQEKYRQRTVLLSKVQDFWIEGILGKSLYSEAMIQLGLEERADLVDRPFYGFNEFSEESKKILPPGTDASTLFNQMGDGRTLLILGEPGAGKTFTLLKLAQSLMTHTKEDIRRSIPVIFNLSSWGSKQPLFQDWLVEELWTKYQVSKVLGQEWIEQQHLILLLDGLDEVKAEARPACVEAINDFIQNHGQTEIVVCSRIAEYEALSTHLLLRGAILIHPLTPEQIDQYLDRVGEPLQGVKVLLQEDAALQELAKSPLTLSVMTLAYQGRSMEELAQIASVEERRKHLLDAYIERMFRQEKVGKPLKDYKPPYSTPFPVQEYLRD
jgi:energy-coupling factor transporter ATP-binding protein EcfA2